VRARARDIVCGESGESISPREIIGAVVIGSALLLIDGRLLSFVPGRSIPKARS
jgi:hypothetical protein